MTGPAATTRTSRVLIPCGDELLSGVFTTPTVEPNGMCAIFYSGRWAVTSIGRGRLFVHISRQLAAHGYHSLRLDFLGLGESTGPECEFRLDKPRLDEAHAAHEFVRRQGITKFVQIGTCGGGRLALASGRDLEGLAGVVMLSSPPRDFLKGERTATLTTSAFVKRAFSKEVLLGLRDRRRRRRYLHHLRGKVKRLVDRARGKSGAGGQKFEWVSSTYLDPLEQVLRRGVPVLLFYGDLDSFYEDFEKGRPGRLGRLLEKAGDLVTLVVEPGTKYHWLSQADTSRLALAAIEGWFQRVGEHPKTDAAGPGVQPEAASAGSAT